MNLRAVRATMPTPHSEGKVNGGQTMNYRANPFQDYELITIDEGRLCLTQPAGYPRFEYQSKNIHDKIMMKVNSVLLAERRHFPLSILDSTLSKSRTTCQFRTDSEHQLTFLSQIKQKILKPLRFQDFSWSEWRDLNSPKQKSGRVALYFFVLICKAFGEMPC